MLRGLERARGVHEFGTQPVGLIGGVGLGPGGGLASLLGHGRSGDRLLASLLFAGQCLAEPLQLMGMRGSGAAGLVAFAFGLAYPFLPVLGLPTKGGELAFPVRCQLLEFGDTDTRRGVQRGQLGGSLLGGVAVVLGLALTASRLVGDLLGLDAGGLMLADLAPGVLLALFGAVAGGLGLGAGLFGGGDPGGGGVGRRGGALLGRRGGGARLPVEKGAKRT